MAIKVEIDKLCQVKFIFPIEYTYEVSNLGPITKKHGTIRICTRFRDLNRAYPNNNFPAPFIDQIVDSCAGHEALSLMDDCFGYNQIRVCPKDQYKTIFTTPWGRFTYWVMPFDLKMLAPPSNTPWNMLFMTWPRLSSHFSMISLHVHDVDQTTYPICTSFLLDVACTTHVWIPSNVCFASYLAECLVSICPTKVFISTL